VVIFSFNDAKVCVLVWREAGSFDANIGSNLLLCPDQSHLLGSE
jgi:hypothetical protein